jgi:large subunit ribosomal protein L21
MSKIAVIMTGGKQYKVTEGDVVRVEKIEGEPNASVSFDTLMVVDGDKIEFGAPMLDSKVTGTIVKQTRDPKILVVKFKAKSRYRRRHGHRQLQTEIKIDKI